MYKVSVVIPTFRRLELLKIAVASVLNQTFKNFEIIIVNDDPAQKSQIENEFSSYQNIRVLHHPNPRGGNAARNTGISNSEGYIIAFLDDDDIWLPDKLEHHVNQHIHSPDVGLVFSDCRYVYFNELIPDHNTTSTLPQDIIKGFSNGNFCPATTSIVSIKAECIKKCGLFDESLVSFQDWDFWFRIAHHFSFAHIPKVLVHFRQHTGERTSQNETKRLTGLNQISEKWATELSVEEFKKVFTRSMFIKNAKNALLLGKRYSAFKKSLPLISATYLNFSSLKSFIKIILQIFRSLKFN